MQETQDNPAPDATNSRPHGPVGGWSLRSKGLGMLLLVTVYAFFLATYATGQKNQLLERFNELQRLHDTEGAIRLTELAAFRDITEFFLFLDSDEEVGSERLRAHIQDLQRRQQAVMSRFPEIGPTFAGLSHALARAHMNPGPESLDLVRTELGKTQEQLQQLAEETTRRQHDLADDYYALGDAAAMNSLLLGLFGVVGIGLVAMFFFTGLTLDIRRLEQRVVDVVHGYRGDPLQVRRSDELGQLALDVNRMVEELAQREKDLDLERRKTFQQEKMASIGTLAAGIVHEIGNPVAAISGLLHTLQADRPQAPDHHAERLEMLGMIQAQVDRLAAIARDVSDFAVPQSGQRELLDLNGLIRNTHRFMRFDRRVRNIDVELDLDAGLPALFGVADQLTQLMMNLLINAADAMEGGREAEPWMRISTRAANGRAVIVVEDNGHGMDAETREKALDPFYTTKGAGKGTGLGLPLCYTVASEHGGIIEIESAVDRGTRIRVVLPFDERTRSRDDEEVFAT